MASTVIRPQDAGLAAAARLGGAFALVTLALHFAGNVYQAHLGYGYFRDEMYYILCGRHLAWGYVDHGPLVAVQARLSETLFGRSLAGLRLLSSLGGALRVLLTGLLAWALAGRRSAQALAMIAVSIVPNYLGTDGYLSMNSWESFFWMTCLLALILVERLQQPRLWMLFGLSAGLGLLNKPSMTFFLLALLVALLCTRQRKLLLSWWAAGGVGLLLLIVLPHLLWQVHHQLPTLEFLHNGQQEHKNIALAPIPFLLAQVREMNPINLLVWVAGLVFLLRRERLRWLGLAFLFFVAGMLVLHAKYYYVTPVYPILFAAGGVAWESRFAESRRVQAGRIFAFPILEGLMVFLCALFLPMSIPVLTPPAWIAYTRMLHLDSSASNNETMSSGALPQFYADRFGWQEEADQVRRIFYSLSPAEQQQTVILCDNYGEASALNFLAPDLPTAISGHNNYWLWGPGTKPGAVLIDIEHTTPAHLRQFYSDVRIAGHLSAPWAMPYEHKDIFLMREPHQTLQSLWPDKKDYI